jgi:hypothetical protein
VTRVGSSCPPRVYVAGPSSDLDRARAVMRELERRGATVAHDWPAEVERLGGRLPESASARRLCAEADLLAVSDADVVLGLLGPPSVGRAHELGAALLRRVRGEAVRVCTSGPCLTPSIWDELCEHLGEDRDAVRSLTRELRSAPSVVERACDQAEDALRRGFNWHGQHDARLLLADARELLSRPRSAAELRALGAARALLDVLVGIESWTAPRGPERDRLSDLAIETRAASDEEDHLLVLARGR